MLCKGLCQAASVQCWVACHMTASLVSHGGELARRVETLVEMGGHLPCPAAAWSSWVSSILPFMAHSSASL